MMKVNKKLAFYGGGHMAENFIRGITGNDTVAPENIKVCELFPQRCKYLEETYGVAACPEVEKAVNGADMVLIGVNPNQVVNVTKVLKDLLTPNMIVLSYATGISIADYEEQLGESTKIVRILPNILSQSGCGYSSVCYNGNLDDQDKEFVDELLQGMGKVLYIDEAKFNAFQAFGCTGPLWIYKFAEAMIDAGIYVGFTRKEASDLLLENMLAVAKLLQKTGESPTAKIEEMTSPGGVTIEGIRALEDNGGYVVPSIASMEAAFEKCASMVKK